MTRDELREDGCEAARRPLVSARAVPRRIRCLRRVEAARARRVLARARGGGEDERQSEGGRGEAWLARDPAEDHRLLLGTLSALRLRIISAVVMRAVAPRSLVP